MDGAYKGLQASLKPGKYVLAVSGGVDSVVLLDLLAEQKKVELVVAHFDHGIRPDSIDDRKFVGQLAERYGWPFEYGNGQLGPNASEATARQARYKFLNDIKAKHSAEAIITAHHQDDVIETAIINLIRGTYRKGLSSLKSTGIILRPLADVPRSAIEAYARQSGLEWRDDPTNADTRYLRNYVRLKLIPQLNRRDGEWRQRLLNKINRSRDINLAIDDAIEHLVEDKLEVEPDKITIPRSWLIMLPNPIGQEVLNYAFARLDRPLNLNHQLIKSSLLFAKTARAGKRKPLSTQVEMTIKDQSVLIYAKPAV